VCVKAFTFVMLFWAGPVTKAGHLVCRRADSWSLHDLQHRRSLTFITAISILEALCTACNVAVT